MKEAEHEFPMEWYCPITQELMRDPVIADDGFTYERKAIQEWFAKSPISPLTGAKMGSLKIIPNIALKQTIQTAVEKKKGSHVKV